MKQLKYLLFFFSILSFSQIKTDSIKIKNKTKYKPILFVSFDVFGFGKSFFTNSSKYEGMLTLKANKNIDFSAVLGYQSGTYDKINWIMNGKGLYTKIGANYFLSKDYENHLNGFYVGGKLAFTTFSQEIQQYPIYGNKKMAEIPREILYGSFPSENIFALWLEFNFGVRVQIGKSKFYLISELEPKIILSGKSQNNIESLFIPGLGKNNELINFDLFSGIAYKF